ncbi:hypothetical protein [Cellulosimicrobium marinum]|uniref:hypothetical protein n=1 Tax=Cellulosimicrobium marinum TaxID=1638992 RepID=UPI001E52FE59|nr:hypothetical protein [Cellulosimicrobium marinum]MCB7137061.1 hypothetical protein [Cellulosimicrobium marinum]
MTLHSLYGLVVDVDTGLHLPPARLHEGTVPDLRVRARAGLRENDAVPEGDLLLDYREEDDHWYSVARRDDGTVLFRVYGLCDVVLSPDLRDAELRLLDGVDPGMASVMTTGALCSLVLYLRGTSVLHASAVSHDGRTVAFMGRSGQGKSTMAALLCAAGAELVTDDVLPVVSTDPVEVAVGSPEVRLRTGVRELAQQASAGRERRSADGRDVLTLRADDAGDGARRLDALVIPAPNHDGRLELVRLPAKEALLATMSFPRLMGWQDPGVVARQFTTAAAIAEQVPVVVAHVPWGPPFGDDVVEAVWDVVRTTRVAG